MERGRCESPYHVRNCSGKGETDDHFTPQCVQKIAGIKDRKENHQYLSVYCHREKDKDTPLRASVLRLEKQGVIFTFAEHREIFETGHLPGIYERGRSNQRRITRHNRSRFTRKRR